MTQGPAGATRRHSVLTTTLVYVGVGIAWTVVTSVMFHTAIADRLMVVRLFAAESLTLVGMTALTLYILLRRRAAAIERSQSELRKQQTLLEHVTAASPIVLFQLEIRDGRPTPIWFSSSVHRLLGYTQDEVMVPDWWFSRLHPEDRDAAVQAVGSLHAMETVTHEYRLRRQDGAYRWVRDTLRVAGRTATSLDVIGASQDVHEERSLALELREQDRYFQRLIENALDTIMVLREDGTVDFASPAVQQHTGYTVAELTGRNAFDVVHPDDITAARTAFENALREDTPVRQEFRIRHRDGQVRDISALGRGLRAHSGQNRLVIHARDVTESKRLEGQLRQAQKLEAVGQFTAGIVHDFNNMLSVVIGNAELLRDALPDTAEEQRGDVETIRRAAENGAVMIRKLLGFSRQAALRIVPTDLASVLGDAVTMLRRVLPRQIQIALDVAPDLPPVQADAGAIGQVLFNIATNARDAMPDGGDLRIVVETRDVDALAARQCPGAVPGKYVAIRVTDNGTGMEDDTLANMFDPFFTTKPVGQGTGLGMPMIQGLVKQQSGFLQVDSTLGEGTTVAVCLPLAAVHAEPKRTAGAAKGKVRGNETILLVEDEEALRRTGRRILESLGYSVLLATDGEECLRVLEQQGSEIALVVCDVQLPKVSGLDVYREIRHRGYRVQCVLSTGMAVHDLREREGLDPSVFLLQKPWTIEEVARSVRQALDAAPSQPSAGTS